MCKASAIACSIIPSISLLNFFLSVIACSAREPHLAQSFGILQCQGADLASSRLWHFAYSGTQCSKLLVYYLVVIYTRFLKVCLFEDMPLLTHNKNLTFLVRRRDDTYPSPGETPGMVLGTLLVPGPEPGPHRQCVPAPEHLPDLNLQLSFEVFPFQLKVSSVPLF